MMTIRCAVQQRQMKKRRYFSGIAAVEFALLVPMLLLLAIPIFDLARIVQANMILINISREGANLALRMDHCPDSTQTYPQCIMDAIASTAPPLNMQAKGMIYITKVMGNQEGASLTNIRNVIVAQDKWLAGGYATGSAVWTCTGGWSNGSCSGIPSNPDSAPTATNVMTGKLADGQVIYVVESAYNTTVMFSAMNLGFGIQTPQFNTALYAKTIF